MRRARHRDNSQTRRRARRAANRRVQHGLSDSDVRDIQDLVAAATVEPEIETHVVGEEGEPELENGFGNAEDSPEAKIAALAAEVLGDKPDEDTEAQENPEESALDAIDAYQASEEPESEQEPHVAALTQALIEMRPDLAEHEEQLMRIAQRTLLSLSAAAGDLVWGPEEGFMDLLCDVNKLLHPGDDESWYEGPWAADASIKLDKVLICDDGDYFVAPITIDGTGEPVLGDKSDWIAVEDAGYVETDDALKLREAIVGGKFSLIAAPVAEIPEAAEVIPEGSDDITPPEAPAAASGDIPWHATFIPEGKLTEDGRAFAPGSTLIPPEEGARDLPLTLMAMIETSAEGGHDGAKVAGRIDNLYRTAPNIEADGVFSNEEYGAMIARMVESQELKGLSVDIAPLSYEWVPRDQYFSEGGDWIGVWNEDASEWAPAPGTEALGEGDDDPLSIFFGEDDRILLITRACIGAATVCPFPAFGDASIGLTAAGMPSHVIVPLQMEMPRDALLAAGIPLREECHGEVEVVDSTATGQPGTTHPVAPHDPSFQADEPVLTAAAAGHAPVKPPADWFADPEFAELTPLTIADDGRVYGHAWQWETCHLSFDTCVTAPHSEANYGYFLFGEAECENGERLNVGRITYDTGHAGTRLSRAEAVRHYDDTGAQAAFVQFGEDQFGGWFAGAVVPDMPDEDLQRFRASAISGDWRGIDGNLELVALLAVNVGGFPVPRGAITAAGDEAEPLSLVAAGVVTDSRLAHIKRMIGEAVLGDIVAGVED